MITNSRITVPTAGYAFGPQQPFFTKWCRARSMVGRDSAHSRRRFILLTLMRPANPVRAMRNLRDTRTKCRPGNKRREGGPAAWKRSDVG